MNSQINCWTHPLPPMITACDSPSVTTHDNRWLVVIGGDGDDGGTMLSRVEILDTTESRQCFHTASLPRLHSEASLATIGNMCYLLGGFMQPKGVVTASKKVFSVCLDNLISQAVRQPASSSAPPTPSPWQELPDTPLTDSTALAFNRALLAVGGGIYESNAIYHYQPSSRSWIKAGELPTGRYQCICAVLPNKNLYVAGGGGNFGSKSSVDIASGVSVH